MSRRDLLCSVLAEPGLTPMLGLADWDWLLRVARRERVLARLGFLLEDQGVGESECPPAAWDILRGARPYPELIGVRAGWELRKLLEASRDLDFELILLKGTGYLKAGLPLSRGRIFSDVDILVRRDQLPRLEERLLARGWVHQKLNTYDQRYYREWMHEIPPLRHPERGIEVDIHHRILPLTSRLNPDPSLLWEASVALPERGLRVLGPADMVLHCATHLLQDGEVKDGFKELLDLHQMLLHFGAQRGFWEGLGERATALELERPLFYGLELCSAVLQTPIPEAVLSRARQGAPRPFGGRLTMELMRRTILSKQGDGGGTPVSDWLLYVRSHWLRMPPWLLAKHLSRKGARRISGSES